MREFKSAEKKNKRNPKQIDIDACNKGEAAKSARRELCIIIDGYFIDYRPLDARNKHKGGFLFALPSIQSFQQLH